MTQFSFFIFTILELNVLFKVLFSILSLYFSTKFLFYANFLVFSHYSTKYCLLLKYNSICTKENRGDLMDKLNFKKSGTITVSVYKSKVSDRTQFEIESDCEDVLPVSYVIEDTLYLY